MPARKSSISEADFVIPTRKNLSDFLQTSRVCSPYAPCPRLLIGTSRCCVVTAFTCVIPTSLFCAMSSSSLMFASIISTRERSALRRFRLDRNRCASRSVISCRVMPARTPSWDSSSSMCSLGRAQIRVGAPAPGGRWDRKRRRNLQGLRQRGTGTTPLRDRSRVAPPRQDRARPIRTAISVPSMGSVTRSSSSTTSPASRRN